VVAWLPDLGRLTLMAFGLTSVEVTIKNMSKRKIISVMEAMLKSGFTFDFLLSAIMQVLEAGQ
jgi:hypothetical protein